MIQYIFKRKISEMKEAIGNIMMISFIVAILTVCFQIILRLNMMLENEWYKNSLELAAINDYFIREKMGVIIKAVFATIAILYVFCIIIYLLKLKLDIVKERTRISVFQVLGYTRMQICLALFFSKIFDLLWATFMGGFLAWGIWNALSNHETFSNFMTLINEDIRFRMELLGVNVGVLLIISLPATYLVLVRNVHMLDMKGETNE